MQADRIEGENQKWSERSSLLADHLRQALRTDDSEEGQTTMAEALMSDAVRSRATDIHIDPVEGNYRIRFRIDGVVVSVARLDGDEGLRLANQFRALAYLNPVASSGPEGGRFSYMLDQGSLDVRVTVAPCISGDKLAIRILAPERVNQQVSELGLNQQAVELLEDWLASIGGMLMVAGPTGSGKTTTLYALLHQLKMTDRHVITLEDPVEYEIPGINQMPVNPDRGMGFAQGAQAMLRLDPDFLVIGELTEAASARAAVNAAAGGRATMATIHSRDAVDTVTVLRNFGLDDFEVASNLQLVVAQRLVRRLCTHCRQQREPNEHEVRWLEGLDMKAPESCWDAPGCEACQQIGFKGRTGIFEVWRPDDEDYGLILDGAGAHEIRRKLLEADHRFLLDDGLAKAEDGMTSLGEMVGQGALGHSSAASGRKSLLGI
jgi:general secretion pathway protein E